ncbi:MAG: DNA repair protein RadA [Elusimicrobia bacterium]|nr:DNA repair protein RadA [Elusimicrobiota bacterium]
MMSRLKSVYRCQECGYSAPKGMGQCPDCSAWNTMTEEVVEVRPSGAAGLRGGGARLMTDFSSDVIALGDVAQQDLEQGRFATGITEFDRLLGGGVVEGQVILLAGPPGIGKSTLMLQAAWRLARGRKVVYVSGEESLKQVSGRCQRLGIKSRAGAEEGFHLLSETSLEKILAVLEEVRPWGLVLDSIQTVYHPELASGPGSVTQVRECAAEILRVAKKTGAVVFLLGHVTKDGTLAGPKVLEHIVDTVLYFDTERHDLLRVLRAQKNRFGPTDEVGLFEMNEKGLAEVQDLASFFLVEDGMRPQAGRGVSVTLEGSRPMLVETQALVVYTKYPLPRRMATGLDLNRVLVLLAAMEKHVKLRLEEKDVYVSLAGGVRLKDPALDLAVCLSVLSSAKEMPLDPDWVLLGEVSLLGELGRVPHLETRLKEAAKAGFKKALIPERALKELSRKDLGLGLVGAADLPAAAELLFAGGNS